MSLHPHSDPELQLNWRQNGRFLERFFSPKPYLTLLATFLNPLPPSDAVRNNYFRGSLQFSIVTILKKCHPPENKKINYLGIFQSLKLRISMEKILSILLKLNFTPNTLGCYGLTLLKCNLNELNFIKTYLNQQVLPHLTSTNVNMC